MTEQNGREAENAVEKSLLQIREALVSGQFDKLPELVNAQERLIKKLEDGRMVDRTNRAFFARLKALSDANLRLTRAALEGLAQARETVGASSYLRSYGPQGESRFLSTRR